MSDSLLENDPWVQEYVAKREAKAEAKGRAKEKVKNMRESIELFVQLRFPKLSDLVRERIKQTEDLLLLQKVLMSLYVAPDENNARSVLLSVPVEDN
jgi:hypothetical protein